MTKNQLVAAVVYDLMGYLTTRPRSITLGSKELSTPALEVLQEWAERVGVDLKEEGVGEAITVWRAELQGGNPDLIQDVRAFHEKFDVPLGRSPHLLNTKDWAYRYDFLVEEMTETMEAYQNDDLAGVADGLIDLVYVALGTLLIMGIPVAAGWREVQRANMAKERVAASLEKSTRGHHWDVVKPEGWLPPRWADILEGARL